MKLKTVQSMIRSGKCVVLYDSDNEQWIGDGSAAYPLAGLPKMELDNLQTFFDMTDKQWEKMKESREQINFNIEDNIIEESDLEPIDITVRYRGREIIPLFGTGRVFFIQAKYIKPFSDEITYYLRKLDNGTYCIAVKEGFFIKAVIMPLDCVDHDLLETVRRLYSGVADELTLQSAVKRQEQVVEEFQNLEFDETEADEE